MKVISLRLAPLVATLFAVLQIQDCSAEMKAFVCPANSDLSASEAKELLAKVQTRYSSIETLHGDFRQDSYVAALDEQESSSGEMWFGKPGNWSGASRKGCTSRK